MNFYFISTKIPSFWHFLCLWTVRFLSLPLRRLTIKRDFIQCQIGRNTNEIHPKRSTWNRNQKRNNKKNAIPLLKTSKILCNSQRSLKRFISLLLNSSLLTGIIIFNIWNDINSCLQPATHILNFIQILYFSVKFKITKKKMFCRTACLHNPKIDSFSVFNIHVNYWQNLETK